MAITKATRQIQTQVITPIDGNQLQLVEDWFLETDDTGYGSYNPAFFVGDPNFPAIGAGHPDNPAFRFETFGQIRHNGSANKMIATGMLFSTAQREFDDDFNADRFDDSFKADRSWRFMQVDQIVERAYVADPAVGDFARPLNASAFSSTPQPIAVRNTGEPMVGLTKPGYIPVCTYTRNELATPGLIANNWVGSVNTDSIVIDGLTVGPHRVLIQDIQVSTKKTSLIYVAGANQGLPVTFRTVTYQLAVNVNGWDDEVLQQGFYTLVNNGLGGVGMELIRVADGWDSQNQGRAYKVPSSPQLIDRNGYAIETNPASLDYDPNWVNNVHYRVFRHLNHRTFASLVLS